MKYFIIVISILISGCAFQYFNGRLENVDEKSIKEFAIVEKTTNLEVLRKYGKPDGKSEASDGTFSYHYAYMPKKIMLGIDASNEFKNFTFNFNKNAVLKLIHFQQGVKYEPLSAQNKYSNLEGKITEKIDDIDKKGNMTLDEYNEIKINSFKAKIMREYGMPLTATEDKEDKTKEFWCYIDKKNRNLISAMLPGSIYISYFFEFKNDRLQNKKIVKYGVPLTKQELDAINNK